MAAVHSSSASSPARPRLWLRSASQSKCSEPHARNTANKALAVYAAEPVADFLAVTFTTILLAFQLRKALRSIESA